MLRESQRGPVTRFSLSRTLLGRPVHFVSAYLVDGLLIDAGPYHTRREIVAAARAGGARDLFITHHHEDHTGGAGALHRSLGLLPQAGALTVPYLIRPPRIHLYRQIVWGRAEPTPAQTVTQVETDHYRFDVLATPGHSPDHTVLYESRQGWVFSGDLFIHEQAKYMRADEDLAALMQSLRRIAALDPQVLFCGHAGPITEPRAAIQRKLAYWERVRDEARALQARGEALPNIRTQVLGPEGPMTRFSRGHLSKLNLLRALVVAGSPG